MFVLCFFVCLRVCVLVRLHVCVCVCVLFQLFVCVCVCMCVCVCVCLVRVCARSVRVGMCARLEEGRVDKTMKA